MVGIALTSTAETGGTQYVALNAAQDQYVIKECLLIGSILFLLTGSGCILTTRPDSNAPGIEIYHGDNAFIYTTDRYYYVALDPVQNQWSHVAVVFSQQLKVSVVW